MTPTPPPLPTTHTRLTRATTVMLVPTIAAIGGALLINYLHYDDGLSLMRRTPHWWRMGLHMLLYIAAVFVALVINMGAAAAYNAVFTRRRRLTLLFLNLAALPAGWFLCQPRSCYYAGLAAGYDKLDHQKLQVECATMPALIAQSPHPRNYLLLNSRDPNCRKWWNLLPPYVLSLDPNSVYIEPDRVVLVLDPAFIEVQTGDNGLYVPLTNAANLAPTPNLHALPASKIMRLDNHHWEHFRTDKTVHAVYPYVPTPAARQNVATRPSVPPANENARASNPGTFE